MERLKFSVVIDAPKEKVWDIMLGGESYMVWAQELMPGSHYLGDWSEGSKIYFLAPDFKGRISGIVARVKENRQYEYVSLEHIGIVEGEYEDTSSDQIKGWAGTKENYLFFDVDGKTELVVEMDSEERNKDLFNTLWPKALEKLKEIVEGDRDG